MRRQIALSLLIAVLIAPSAALAARTYSADRFDVELALQRDGSMVVTETIVLRFSGGAFTEFSRRIPTDRTDGIAMVTASLDGTPWPVGKGAGRLEIKREKGLTAIWRFGPVADSVHVFVLRYRVLGVVERRTDGDVLTWRALPGDRRYAVRSSIVRLDYPEGATILGEPVVEPAAAVSLEQEAVALVVGEVSASQSVRLAVRFGAGTATTATPEWQSRRVRGLEVAPSFAAGAGLILLSGLAWILLFWNSHRREPLSGDKDARRSVPPGDLPAALAGALTSMSQSPRWVHAFGSLIDLARRGLLRVEESPERTWYRPREFVVRLVQRPGGLRPHEGALLDLLFVTKKGPRTAVKFSELPGAVQSGWKGFRRAVLGELDAMGLVSIGRRRTRRWLLSVATILIVAGGAGFVPAALLFNRFEGWPMMLPGAVTAVGIAALAFGSGFSTLSDEGRRQSAAWRPFFRYLRDVSRGGKSIAEPETFDRYLPYAAAAGISGAWAKAFRKSGQLVNVPRWFHSLATSAAGHPVDAFVAMLGAAVASTGHVHGAA